MNIFASYPCPKQSAIVLDDRRVIKMILESAQMLCTVLSVYGYKDIPYKPTHHNHPCTKWAAENFSNYSWLYHHMLHLNEEYERRYSHGTHKSIKTLQEANVLEIARKLLTEGDLTPFVNCTADHKEIDDVHEAYRQCLVGKWTKSSPGWTNRQPPYWFTKQKFCLNYVRFKIYCDKGGNLYNQVIEDLIDLILKDASVYEHYVYFSVEELALLRIVHGIDLLLFENFSLNADGIKNLSELPNNLVINNGYLDLGRYYKKETLPRNLSISGAMYLNHSGVRKLPEDLTVGDFILARQNQLLVIPENLKHKVLSHNITNNFPVPLNF